MTAAIVMRIFLVKQLWTPNGCSLPQRRPSSVLDVDVVRALAQDAFFVDH
jgi:hypothetical protein